MSKAHDIKENLKCRICKMPGLTTFLDFGSTPLPNAFLAKKQFKDERFFPLRAAFCKNCGLVQLRDVVNPQTMFGNYLYIPSTAKVMMNNFSTLVYEAYKKAHLTKKSLVLDIGSNDGSLLELFRKLGVGIVGVDPAENLAKIANSKQIPTETGLFDLKMARKVLKKYGTCDLITATNVVAHIDDLDELFKSISVVLKPGGLFICEFPYLLDLITKNQFDTIYHEHLSYFSLKPWQRLVNKYGFEIVEAKRLVIHGGSIRLTHRKSRIKAFGSEAAQVIDSEVAQTRGARRGQGSRVKGNVRYLLDLEEQHNLYEAETYEEFAKNIQRLKKELRGTLLGLRNKGKKIIGFGAAAKGNILTNFFNIDNKILDYIVDSTSYKHGLYTPGKHIPIYPEEKLLNEGADYGLILAWNFADEIMRKHKHFKSSGGKFIIPIPEVKIV